MSSTSYSCKILMKLEFSLHTHEKNIEKSNFVKSRPVGAELFHADGQTDRHYEAKSRFFSILRTRLITP